MERKERRHHTREFKLEAVRLAAVGDKTKAKVARELGVRETNCANGAWTSKKRNATAFPSKSWARVSRTSGCCGVRTPGCGRRMRF